jgi:hypothetical protein
MVPNGHTDHEQWADLLLLLPWKDVLSRHDHMERWQWRKETRAPDAHSVKHVVGDAAAAAGRRSRVQRDSNALHKLTE